MDIWLRKKWFMLHVYITLIQANDRRSDDDGDDDDDYDYDYDDYDDDYMLLGSSCF